MLELVANSNHSEGQGRENKGLFILKLKERCLND